MVISDRLRELRESKNLSQGDIERRTGLLRCYLSRVENGHTVPASYFQVPVGSGHQLTLGQRNRTHTRGAVVGFMSRRVVSCLPCHERLRPCHHGC